jgi:hypothetical protein
MSVGVPARCKIKPRGMDEDEWKEVEKPRRLTEYQQVLVTGKVDRVVSDVKELLQEAEDADEERPVKVIIYR